MQKVHEIPRIRGGSKELLKGREELGALSGNSEDLEDTMYRAKNGLLINNLI